MAGLFGLGGLGLAPLAGWTSDLAHNRRARRRLGTAGTSARASPLRALASTLVLAAWALAGWLPLVGLVHLATGPAGSAGASTEGGARAHCSHAGAAHRPAAGPSARRQLLGFWSRSGVRHHGARLASSGRRSAIVPRGRRWLRVHPADRPAAAARARRPVSLALPWLAGLASRFLLDAGRPAPAAGARESGRRARPVSEFLDLDGLLRRLALAPRLFSSWRGMSELGRRPRVPGRRPRPLWWPVRRGLGLAVERSLASRPLAGPVRTGVGARRDQPDTRASLRALDRRPNGCAGVVVLAGGAGEAPLQAAALALLARGGQRRGPRPGAVDVRAAAFLSMLE